ncbi:hypothetical protein DC74_2627 [Streptomyces noursei]|nr:hypothetical protein DC74_2627 [Streptomyces noursei]
MGATVQPALAASTAVTPGSKKVEFHLNNHGAPVSGEGTLSWNGEGGYTFAGDIGIGCDAPTNEGRVTAWLEYGGTSESWKKSNEADCDKQNGQTDWHAVINVSGTLKKGEKLELRVSSWNATRWFDPYQASERQVFTIS